MYSCTLRQIPYIEADFASKYCAEILPQCMKLASMYGIGLNVQLYIEAHNQRAVHWGWSVHWGRFRTLRPIGLRGHCRTSPGQSDWFHGRSYSLARSPIGLNVWNRPQCTESASMYGSASKYGIGLNVQLSDWLGLNVQLSDWLRQITWENKLNVPQCTRKSASMYGIGLNVRISLNVQLSDWCTLRHSQSESCTLRPIPYIEANFIHWGRISAQYFEAKSASMYGIGLNVQLYIEADPYIEADSVHWGRSDSGATAAPLPASLTDFTADRTPSPGVLSASMYGIGLNVRNRPQCMDRPQCMESASMYSCLIGLASMYSCLIGSDRSHEKIN